MRLSHFFKVTEPGPESVVADIVIQVETIATYKDFATDRPVIGVFADFDPEVARLEAVSFAQKVLDLRDETQRKLWELQDRLPNEEGK